jgi:two-component system, OmpR family, copper resistance phosphate regulon response regulator CusR
MRLLLIEDYLPLARSVAQGLREAGYGVDVATDGDSGLSTAKALPYDGIVLDLMLPKLDGFSVLEALRRSQIAAAVLILTARHDLSDRVRGLDLGADDYLVKPFAFEELLARIRALLRRRYGRSQAVIMVADIEIDTSARIVRRGSHVIDLSAREYALLEYLAERRGQTVTRSEIWDHVYDFASEPSSNVIDVYIGYLRKKIDQDSEVKLIRTRRGLGYVFGETD